MSEKNLSCKKTHWNNLPVVSLPLNELWQSVIEMRNRKHQGNFYKNLYMDIESNGLVNPLIIVKSSISELQKQKEKHKNGIRELPDLEGKDFVYVIWGGSNRYAVAKEMGYTHIDCVIVKDYQEAFKFQGEQRSGFAFLRKK